MNMKYIEGGVCAAKGYKASGVHCGIRKNKTKKDLALIVSDVPASAAGVPFTAAYLQSKGDPITDLYEDMAAEQKARSTYEYLIDLAEDPAVLAPLRFLREREIVHFQRFGEALDIARDYLNQQHYFFMQKNGCNTK